ncbi:MAG: hypothetical protein ACFFG0_12840 [Candidatus Thorarchaeota archaeon]
MKFNFKKISAITTSIFLATASIAFASAAAYPQPFVTGGVADVGVVYGTGSGVSDLDQVQAYNINLDLQGYTTGGTSSDTVTGEAYALFTSSKGIYMNESINSVRGSVTDTDLPTVLADGDFEGDVSADYTQLIQLGDASTGNYAKLLFGQQPTSDDDPVVAFQLGTDTLQKNYLYNLTINFDQAVNFTDTDSIGSTLNLFGREYTVGAGSTTTKLYLFESSETISLCKGTDCTDPSSATVSVNGEDYTVELVLTSDTAATIKLTDSSGSTDSKTIDEDNSKKMLGLDVAVDYAEEGTNIYLADVTVGANKILLQNGKAVKQGSDEDTIKGTHVERTATTNWIDTTAFTISVGAADTDVDALLAGESFVDPVFGTIKIDFSSLENDDSRESIKLDASGSDKFKIDMITHTGDEGDVLWFNNDTGAAILSDQTRTDVFNLMEMQQINYTEYAVVGNEDQGYLLELTTCENETGQSDDEIEFTDVFSGSKFKGTPTSEHAGTINIGGADYNMYYGSKTNGGSDTCYVRLDYPDSTTNPRTSGTADAVLYPTIETSKGAKVFFYEPYNISLSHWNASLGQGSTASTVWRAKASSNKTQITIKLPDGNGYSNIVLDYAHGSMWNMTTASTATRKAYWAAGKGYNITTEKKGQWVTAKVGPFLYNISGGGDKNATLIRLISPQAYGTMITLPAVGLFEEENDNNEYEGLIVSMDNDAGSSNDETGVSDVITTYMNDSALTNPPSSTDWDYVQLESNDDLYKSMDLWGTMIITDASTTSQKTVEIQYPDDQIQANVYVADISASISGGVTGAASLGNVVYKDTETSSYNTKNVIVVGGSCINSAAASLVGGAYCTSDWTDATGVGSGEFLIKGYASSDVTSKFALLVAGYDASDTVNAATYLVNKLPDTSKSWKGTTSTAAATEITSA